MITVKTFETAAPGADLDIFFKARNEPSCFLGRLVVSQFQIYLPWAHTCLAGDGPSTPSSGLLHDCENFADGSLAALARRLAAAGGG